MPFISRDRMRPADPEKMREACRKGHRRRNQANAYIAKMDADAITLRQCIADLDDLRAALIVELAAVEASAAQLRVETHEVGGRGRVKA